MAPLRSVEKLTDLSTAEVMDLFLAVQKVQKTIEQVHNTNSSSIVIQDGQHAGQTIKVCTLILFFYLLDHLVKFLGISKFLGF